LYLGKTVARVVKDLESGILVTGPDGAIITAGRAHQFAPQSVYMTP
jgi:hypothetical protein